MKIVDMMEKVFQMRTFKDRINVINKSFPNFWRVQCRSYSSAFIKIHENSYKKSFELTKTRHIRKFNELISKNKVPQSAINITDKKKWVINMSSRQLTHFESDLLSKGLNFSITFKTMPNKDIIATIEHAVKDLEKEQTDTIRVKVSLTLQNSKPPKDNLSKDERIALK